MIPLAKRALVDAQRFLAILSAYLCDSPCLVLVGIAFLAQAHPVHHHSASITRGTAEAPVFCAEVKILVFTDTALPMYSAGSTYPRLAQPYSIARTMSHQAFPICVSKRAFHLVTHDTPLSCFMFYRCGPSAPTNITRRRSFCDTKKAHPSRMRLISHGYFSVFTIFHGKMECHDCGHIVQKSLGRRL